MQNQIKGLALLLFGILLCLSGNELNQTIFASLSSLPFGLVGLVVGAYGLAMVFIRGKGNDTDNSEANKCCLLYTSDAADEL